MKTKTLEVALALVAAAELIEAKETAAALAARAICDEHRAICEKVNALLGKGRTLDMQEMQARSSEKFTEAMEMFAYARGLAAASVLIRKVVAS